MLGRAQRDHTVTHLGVQAVLDHVLTVGAGTRLGPEVVRVVRRAPELE